MKKLIATLFVLGLAACNPTTTAPPADAGPQIGEAIRAQEVAMNAAAIAKDGAAVAAFYAPDAQMFNSGFAPATTPAAILGAYQGLFADPNGSLTLHGSNVILPSSSDYAVAQGDYTVTFSDPAHHRMSQSGSYLTLWRHQDDGSWKIMRDMAAQGPEPAPPSH